MSDEKTDVLGILCDVRGDEVLASPGGQWLKDFVGICKAPSTDAEDIRIYIRDMPEGDLLLATLASLIKWEHNKMGEATWMWSLGARAVGCPLCWYAEDDCLECPLARVDRACDGACEGYSAWGIAGGGGDSSPLIEALRKAVKYVVNEERDKRK